MRSTLSVRRLVQGPSPAWLTRPLRDFRRTTLKRRHCVLVRSIAEAMFTHDHGPTPERLDALVDELDRFISPASKLRRWGIVAMLWVFQIAPLVTMARASAFASLALEDRVRVLERMATSRLIVLAVVLAAYKAILSLLFFEDDEELQAIGYRADRRVRTLERSERAERDERSGSGESGRASPETEAAR